ncbi:MAG: poly-gamma-glutamate synthase PgsB [Acidobacteriota bacterium]
MSGQFFWPLLGVTLALVVFGLVEGALLRRRLRRIPIRIHVNGTRGKSSVTRLIAAGLREGGMVVCAKTTGTLPRLILPDGSEYPIFRVSHANVIEQVRIVAAAARIGSRALVVECMAIRPFLQWLSEARLIRATHAVITNVRADHLDEMGPTEEDVALALAGVIPRGKVLFTAERKHLELFKKITAEGGTECVAVTAEEVEEIAEAGMTGFRHVEHSENVALALKVCQTFGIDRETALRGMWRSAPDPGAMTTHELDFFGRRIVFVNGFAANDPESSRLIWEMMLDRFPDVETRIILFNCRGDRPDRSSQLGRDCASWSPADHYVLIGQGTYILGRAAVKAGVDMRKIVYAENRTVSEVFESCVSLSGRSSLVMGMANIGGKGLEIVEYFKNRSVLKPTA